VTGPLAIDLFSGLGGWTDGLLAEGWRVVGFDIEQHVYGEHCYPAQLVLQDALTIHGRQFRDAHLIVASPPCQPEGERCAECDRRVS
jgi:site-specific DNA-cytosine methylase